jgi:hypothetical protein
MTHDEWIRAAFDLLQTPLAEHDVVEHLISAGCPAVTAYKLVALVPLACGRALMADTGVVFSTNFRGMSADGTVGGPQLLAAEPYWSLIEAFVAAESRARPDAVRAIGMCSAEFHAVNKAALDGSRLEDLVGGPPIFHFVEPEVAPERPQPVTAAPWWAFWRR